MMWTRAFGMIEARWPDGMATYATLHEQNVQLHVETSWMETGLGLPFIETTGPSTAAWYLLLPEAQKLLAPAKKSWNAYDQWEHYLSDVTLHKSGELDWYADGFIVQYTRNRNTVALVFVWQLTPEAQARRQAEGVKCRVDQEAQWRAATADVLAHSLRWAYWHWWYDEYDDSQTMHIECPFCHAFSPRSDGAEGIVSYSPGSMDAEMRCHTCGRTGWIASDFLRVEPEPGSDVWDGES